jgi:hypothetical protein
MSSVSSSAASRIAVSGASSLLAAGKNADDNSSGAAFAVKPATSAQDPESDTPSPTDEVVITADALDAAAIHLQADAAVTIQAAQTAPPNIDAADKPIPLAPAAYDGSPAAQAAYAYAQTMQVWLDAKTAAKTSRSPAARRAPKSDPQTDR